MKETNETLMDLGLDGFEDLFEQNEEIQLSGNSVESKPRDLSFFRNIPVRVTLEVASAELPLGELMQAGKGSVLALDKQAGAPLDVRVNGHLLARGEVVLVNGKYGLRLTEIIDEQLFNGQNS